MQKAPWDTYHHLLEQRRAETAEMDRRLRALGYLRLAMAGAAVAVVWAALTWASLSIAWVVAPAAAFTALLVLQDRLSRGAELRRRSEEHTSELQSRFDLVCRL